jgi:hypothetical protein
MQLQNPYTRGYIDYPLYFEPERMHYYIQHETPFTDRYSEWAVYIIETGDMVYLPYGQNRCRNIYVVTRFYLNKELAFPHGIYTIPLDYFTKPQNNDDDFYYDDDEDEDDLDFDDFI